MTLVAGIGSAVAQTSSLQPTTVIIEALGSRITAADLDAELQKAPPDVRNSLMFRKEGLAQLASNLLMRRVLARQAEASNLAANPVNQAALQIAKDKVLSDLQLAWLDRQNQPSPDVLDKRARDVYKAEAKRFAIQEEVRVSHILIAPGDDAKVKAQSILDELKSGKDFADLAKEKSADPGSAAKGGDLGLFGRGRMVKAFEDAAFALKVGDLSDLVETQFGVHILKVTERKEAGVRPYEEVQETLRNEVREKILNEGRMGAGQQIMSQSTPHPEALDAYIASQKPKD